MARFHVRDAVALKDRSGFVLAGFVIEGAVVAGMAVRIPVTADVAMTQKIEEIQTERRPDGEVTGLCFRCEKPGDIDLWHALKLTDRVVEIVAAA